MTAPTPVAPGCSSSAPRRTSRDRSLSRAPSATMLATPMSSLSPRATLLLLLGLAAMILGGGLRLARQEESVRIDRDREALATLLAATCRSELQRLEALYESHLARLARTLPNDAFEIRREADRIVGVRQFSLLHPEAGRAMPRCPRPGHRRRRANARRCQCSRRRAAGSTRAGAAARGGRFFDDSDARSGWIDEPGKPLMFWQRRSSEEVVVLMIDTPAVEAAVNRWLREVGGVAASSRCASLAVPDQLRTRDGRPLAAGGDRPARPARSAPAAAEPARRMGAGVVGSARNARALRHRHARRERRAGRARGLARRHRLRPATPRRRARRAARLLRQSRLP